MLYLKQKQMCWKIVLDLKFDNIKHFGIIKYHLKTLRSVILGQIFFGNIIISGYFAEPPSLFTFWNLIGLNTRRIYHHQLLCKASSKNKMAAQILQEFLEQKKGELYLRKILKTAIEKYLKLSYTG